MQDPLHLLNHSRHADVPLRHDPRPIGQAAELDPSADLVVPHLPCRPGQVQIAELEPLQPTRFPGEPKDAPDLGSPGLNPNRAELQPDQAGVRFVPHTQPHAMGVQKLIGEEHMRIRSEVAIPPGVGRHPASSQQFLYRTALDGALVRRAREAVRLAEDPEGARLEFPDVLAQAMDVHAGRTGEVRRAKGFPGFLPDSERLEAQFPGQLASPVPRCFDAREGDGEVGEGDSERNRLAGRHVDLLDRLRLQPKALPPHRVSSRMWEGDPEPAVCVRQELLQRPVRAVGQRNEDGREGLPAGGIDYDALDDLGVGLRRPTGPQDQEREEGECARGRAHCRVGLFPGTRAGSPPVIDHRASSVVIGSRGYPRFRGRFSHPCKAFATPGAARLRLTTVVAIACSPSRPY